MQRNVDVLVDGCGDQKSAVLSVVGGQVGASAAERDSQRSTSADHFAASFISQTCSTIRSDAWASSTPGCGGRDRRMSSAKHCHSQRQESSAIGYSKIVVSGGPISGVIR